MRDLVLSRALSAWVRPSRRELQLVALAVVFGVIVRLMYILATRGHPLVGDEIEYDIEGRLAAAGHFLWSTTPYGNPHPTTWKTPGYGGWVGMIYTIFGRSPDTVYAVQTVVFAPIGIGASWALGRVLFGTTVGVIAAAIVAVYPNAWQFDVRLFAEAIASPLTTVALVMILGAFAVTLRRAALVGVLLGVLILLKPSSIVLVPPIAVCWWGLSGARRGTVRLAVTLLAGLVVISPWVIRNYTLDSNHFVPLSVQGSAAYGVFNDDSANDPNHPWGWRAVPRRDRDLFRVRRSDGALYSALNQRAVDYIKAHPSSLPKAFFYNGITRLWDLRPPDDVMFEVPYTGRTKAVAAVGLAMYWPLLALALAGLWLMWRAGRRRLVLAIAALVVSCSIVYTADATTRYRAPFEPLIVVLAVSAVAPRLPVRFRRAVGEDEAERERLVPPPGRPAPAVPA